MGSIVLLDLMGGVALLLWGLRMVLTGVLRAFGRDFQRILGKSLNNRFSAFAAGLGLTALLQSSTATGLMTASLAADGTVSLVAALAIMVRRSSCSFYLSTSWPSLRYCSWSGLSPFGSPAATSQGAWSYHYRARPDFARLAHPGRHVGPGRTGARRARAPRLHHQRSGYVHCHRCSADLGGTFKRGCRPSCDVARLFAVCHY